MKHLFKKYICSQCGARMRFENKYRDTLVCKKCGYSVDIEYYGTDDENPFNYTHYPVIFRSFDDDE